MTDYIERDAVMKMLAHRTKHQVNGGEGIAEGANLVLSILEEYIGSLPVADVAPVKHGKWEIGSFFTYTFKCSVCGNSCRDNTDFCPNCGADMQEVSHDHL